MSWPKRFMWLEYILYIWYLWHWGWQTPNTRPINTNWVKYTRLDVSTAVQYQLSARLVNWLNLTLGYIYYHTATYCVLSRGAIYDSSSLTRRLDIGYRGGSIWKQFLTPLHWTLHLVKLENKNFSSGFVSIWERNIPARKLQRFAPISTLPILQLRSERDYCWLEGFASWDQRPIF